MPKKTKVFQEKEIDKIFKGQKYKMSVNQVRLDQICHSPTSKEFLQKLTNQISFAGWWENNHLFVCI